MLDQSSGSHRVVFGRADDPGTFDQAVHVVEIGADCDGMKQRLVVPAGIVHRGRVRGGHATGRFRELADIAQNWLEAAIDRRHLDIVQRLRKHVFINAEGVRDQGMRAVAIPAAVDAGYEGGNELALSRR